MKTISTQMLTAKVSGMVDFYGSVSVMREDSNPTTINHLQADSPEGMEMGHVDLRENSDLRRKLSVECNISKDTDIPPVLIIHGTKDRTVNTIGSTDLYLKLKECGKEASYILIKGADHGGGEFTSPAVLKELDAFIKHVLA
ncbi:alpha/beta hydrolase family protein [Lactobacillus delbrueckii]